MFSFLAITLILPLIFSLYKQNDDNIVDYNDWSGIILENKCLNTYLSGVTCNKQDNGQNVYKFPSGIFKMDNQLLVNEKISIIGANNEKNRVSPVC